MRWECRERFPCHILQRKPLVSDPGMQHGTCVTHVPWCMAGSPTRGGGKKRSRHYQRMRIPQYYVSGKRPMRTKCVSVMVYQRKWNKQMCPMGNNSCSWCLPLTDAKAHYVYEMVILLLQNAVLPFDVFKFSFNTMKLTSVYGMCPIHTTQGELKVFITHTFVAYIKRHRDHSYINFEKHRKTVLTYRLLIYV